MLPTQSRPNPSKLAAVIAKRNANATEGTEQEPKPTKRRKPYTTESAGYQVRQVLLAQPVAEPPVIETETDDRDEITSVDWMLGAEELGLEWTPRLRRHTVIDAIDPTEALDATPEFLGFHVVQW